jgi:hypothetical protein
MTDELNLPPPGLDGTYRDTCVVCMKGTDTCVSLSGEAEWVVAALHVMGMPMDDAAVLISHVTGCDPGMAPPGQIMRVFRVCRSCAAEGKMEVGPVTSKQIKHYGQGFNVDDGQHRG